MSCRYITSELEEIEREDNFRLKRFKELKIKKNKEKEVAKIHKKDSCTCQKSKTGDGLDLPCMDSNKNKPDIQLEVTKNVCCNADTKSKEIYILSGPDINSFTKNLNESYQQGADTKSDNRYIFSACNSATIQQEKDSCACLSPSTDIKPDVQSHLGAEGDNKKQEPISASCIETAGSCQSLKVKQSVMPSNTLHSAYEEIDKTCTCDSLKVTAEEPVCSCEELKHTIVKESNVCMPSNTLHSAYEEIDKICSCDSLKVSVEEPVCSCEELKHTIVKESEVCMPSNTLHSAYEEIYKTCSCDSLKVSVEEPVCSCEELKHTIVKESEARFSDRKIQTDNLKYSYSCPSSQQEYESHLSIKTPVIDEKKDISEKHSGKSTSSCQPTQPLKVLFADKATHTRSLTDFICSCNILQRLPQEPPLKDQGIDRGNDYIFSACKKRVKGVRREPPKSKRNDSDESEICCKKSSSGENSTEITKSDQKNYKKPSDKSLSCKPLKSQTKVSFQDIGIQTRCQSNLLPWKTSGSLLSKENMGSSVKVGEFKRTFKETVKIIKKPDKDGNIREDHRKKTVKTEKKVIGNPIVSKKSLKQELEIPCAALSDSSKTAQNPCGKECSLCTISQPISLTSTDFSQPVTEKESLIQEVDFNSGDKSTKCCNKITLSHVNSYESIKSANSSCMSDAKSDRLTSKSCKVKIVTKSDEDSAQNDGNQNKVELTPSMFDIIKSFLYGLSKSEASKKPDETKQEQSLKTEKYHSLSKDVTDKTKNKISARLCTSKVVKTDPSKASCCCDNIRNNMTFTQQTVPCKCSSNKEIFQAKGHFSCPCDKSKDNLKLDFESNRSCNKTRSSPIISRRTCMCENNVQDNPPLLPRTDEPKFQGCQCQKNKTNFEPKSEEKSPQCSCSRIQESSTSVCSTARDNTNSSYQKSLRFEDSYSTKTNDASSSLLQKKSDISSKLCCSKPNHYPYYNTTQTQDSICSKCSVTKVDASTSTRRSDKYDVRPLRLLMEIKKHDCLSKSDTAIMKTSLNKKPDSFKPIKRCCSCNNNDKSSSQ